MRKISVTGPDNVVEVPEEVAGKLSVLISGARNRLVIGEGCEFPNCFIKIVGNDCQVTIGRDCKLNGKFRCQSNGSVLAIGANTTSVDLRVFMIETGEINIGEDCMFAADVRLTCSDMHSIIDVASGKRINPPANIVIEDHVWLGFGVFVTKGVRIGANSVVGAKSLVSQDIPANCIAAGAPASVVREGVTWDRKRIPYVAR